MSKKSKNENTQLNVDTIKEFISSVEEASTFMKEFCTNLLDNTKALKKALNSEAKTDKKSKEKPENTKKSKKSKKKKQVVDLDTQINDLSRDELEEICAYLELGKIKSLAKKPTSDLIAQLLAYKDEDELMSAIGYILDTSRTPF